MPERPGWRKAAGQPFNLEVTPVVRHGRAWHARQSHDRPPGARNCRRAASSDCGEHHMGRQRKPARLWLDRARDVWYVLDGGDKHSTGARGCDRAGAHQWLANYLVQQGGKTRRQRDPAAVSVTEALIAYGQERAPSRQAPATIGYALKALLPFWNSKKLIDITPLNCSRYGDLRRRTIVRGKPVGDGTIRRELGVLSAAVNHWHANHGPLAAVPVVAMPPNPPSRERWLTRSEVTLLLAGALGFYRVQACDVRTRAMFTVRWDRERQKINRHLARFILLGLRTGSRSGVLVAAQWSENITGGWVDLERGVFFRSAVGAVQSTKRKPPVRIGSKLLAHLRRWRRLDQAAAAAAGDATLYRHIVSYRGRPVLKVRSAWECARDLSGLDDEVTPHTLRHTRATWAMQQGVDEWQLGGALGMSRKTIDRYAHHHPDWQKRVSEI